MKQNKARKDLAVVKSLARTIARPPVRCRRVCLAAWCAGQCSMRCCTVSGSCRHAGQVGESAFFMRCRCLARGACPVRSWVRILVSFLGNLAVSFR